MQDGQATLQQLLPRAANPHKLQQHYTLLESSGCAQLGRQEENERAVLLLKLY